MRLLKLASTLTLLSTLAVGASLTGGCADNLATVYVDHAIGYDLDNYECVIEPAFDGPGIGSGSYDYFSGRPYTVRLVVGNQMVPQGDNDVLRAETSRITVQGAAVQAYSGAGAEIGGPFSSRIAGTIHPDDSEDPGLIAIAVPIILPNSQLPEGNYLIGIKIYGETLGGTNVESGEFLFPVQVVPYGQFASCASYTQLLEEERLNPCGYGSQDWFEVPCGSSTEGPVCSQCP